MGKRKKKIFRRINFIFKYSFRWFVPFVMDWLNENDEHSMDILRNAYNRDKADNFPQTSEHTKFSNSVVDVFTQLNEALKVLKQVFFYLRFCIIKIANF